MNARLGDDSSAGLLRLGISGMGFDDGVSLINGGGKAALFGVTPPVVVRVSAPVASVFTGSLGPSEGNDPSGGGGSSGGNDGVNGSAGDGLGDGGFFA